MKNKIKLGILGGGGDSLIGIVHRIASSMHDRYQIVGGCFNPNPKENKDFAQACEENDIQFCGPSSKTIDLFGDKLKAKQVAIDAKVPVIPGTEKPVETVNEALVIAKNIGYPVTLKALSGGGGKGIRAVFSETELKEAFERSQSEAKASFGRSDIYIEKNT